MAPEAAARPSEAILRSGIEAVPPHVAILDRRGDVLLLNRAWTEFAAAHEVTPGPRVEVGGNYLEACRGSGHGDGELARARRGVEGVLGGSLPQFTMEYPCHGPRERRWFLMTVTTLGRAGEGGAAITLQEVSAQKQAEEELRACRERLDSLFDNPSVGIAEVAADGRWLRVNQRLTRMLDHSPEELASMTFHELTHPDDRDADAVNLEVLRAGATGSYAVQKRFVRKDGSTVWVHATLTGVRDERHARDYFVGVFEDLSAHKQVERHQHALLRELAHRGKNLLAVIQSLAERSLRGDRSLADAREAFRGRLHALGSTFDALTEEAFGGVLLDAIVGSELASLGAQAASRGPAIMLTAKAAQTFALVIHELATNALKHGALSSPTSHLSIAWEVVDKEGEPRFVFDWREEGGPPIAPPARPGFGTVLLTQVAAAEFHCEPRLSFEGRGFAYHLDAPLGQLGTRLIESAVRRRLVSTIARSLYDAWVSHRGGSRSLPDLAGFDWTRFAGTGVLTIAVVEPGLQLRFLRVGRELLGRLGRALAEGDLAAAEPHGMAEVYRRCAREGQPCHELLRFDFGDGNPLTFERLLVPFSAHTSGTVTHVVGVAIYDGQLAPPPTLDANP